MINVLKINCGLLPKGVMRKACRTSDAWREKMITSHYLYNFSLSYNYVSYLNQKDLGKQNS